MTPDRQYRELQARLRVFSEAVPRILRHSGLAADLAAEIERMLPPSRTSLEEEHFTLAVAGQMRVGKSTLINAMVGADLAIPGVTETTATVNWFRHGTPEQAGRFRVVWDDEAGSSDLVDIAEKELWSGSSERAARTRYLEFYSPAEFLEKVHIVDTPGTRSTLDSHEKAARGFLLNEGKAEKDSRYYGGLTDCVAYVLPPVIRLNDGEVLAQFASGSRLPQSTPFNSVGLLHKWETIQHAEPWAEAERQAARAFQALRPYVCDVVAVSGPLGRACRVCPPGFWDDVLDLVRGTSADAFEVLTVEESWFVQSNPGCPVSPEQRSAIRSASGLPWPCFKTVLLLAASRPFASGVELAGKVREVSGVDRLIEFLERRFFDRSRLIRSSTVLNRALRITDQARGRIRNRLDGLAIERRSAQQALDEIDLHEGLTRARAFIAGRREMALAEQDQLTAILREVDEQAAEVRVSFEQFEGDCRAVQSLDDHPDQFGRDEVLEILDLLGAYDEAKPADPPPDERRIDDLHDRFDRWLILQEGATGERRRVLDQVVARLEQKLLQD